VDLGPITGQYRAPTPTLPVGEGDLP